MYIIVGGGGDVGYYLTKSLLSQGHEVLLLEKGAIRYQALSEELGQSVVRGDACEARTMEEVGVSRADVVIAVTGEDDDNLVICQMAKKRFKVARTIARLNNPKNELLFQKLGIDITVSPTRSILSLIEAELPGSSFVTLMRLRRAGLGIIEVRVPPDSPIVGKTLNAIKLPRSGNIALIIRDNEYIVPTAETKIFANDEVYALVNREGEEALRDALGATR
ncbi:MAG: portal protein [Ktedonobacter sp. 13_1_20CM_3_54_15]|nr:MAG: portal protein [Ktedonobacter sp. 13_2_20CM_2_54_8]OLE08248.1 MAG: portal protein [Ktedonobacter sp. 13_1_20CM_4_53_11]OLE34075.1 MAG: portal protein [Ktedonobacter sp. 13_1_20CM_3_54_15]TMB85444.1 MAG: TrkA family potassium uptake protein [Chloroflexota bacterium]TMC58190.1 MAG: TrkA family potassium uptake protein [Chloroflexota bacterium]